MKEGIHPDYSEITVKCLCGNTFLTRSTKKESTQQGVLNATKNVTVRLERSFRRFLRGALSRGKSPFFLVLLSPPSLFQKQ
jgi:ribosomal protein L31